MRNLELEVIETKVIEEKETLDFEKISFTIKNFVATDKEGNPMRISSKNRMPILVTVDAHGIKFSEDLEIDR